MKVISQKRLEAYLAGEPVTMADLRLMLRELRAFRVEAAERAHDAAVAAALEPTPEPSPPPAAPPPPAESVADQVSVAQRDSGARRWERLVFLEEHGFVEIKPTYASTALDPHDDDAFDGLLNELAEELEKTRLRARELRTDPLGSAARAKEWHVYLQDDDGKVNSTSMTDEVNSP